MKRFRCQQGVAAVEFAIILPLLAALVFGIIEFGLLLYNQQVITNASREGARAGIVQQDPRPTPGYIISVADKYWQNHLISASGPLAKTDVVPAGGCTGFGVDLNVTVTYDYTPFSGLIPGLNGAKKLKAQTIMRCE